MTALGSGPSPHASYTPTMSAEDLERIRRWHEDAYASAQAEAGSGQRAAGSGQRFDYLGRTLVVPPEVMPITRVSHLLGEAVLAEVCEGDRVLDMGTGSGVNAILAASRATDVVAVDVNPVSLQAARDNAVRNGVADRIDVRHSDVFSDVSGAFDLIVFDPPFRWFAPRDLLEAASTDENYRAMTTFFQRAREHLTAGGRMLVFFGTSGDLAYLRSLIKQERFHCDVVAHQDLVKDGVRVDYFTFRLASLAGPVQASV